MAGQGTDPEQWPGLGLTPGSHTNDSLWVTRPLHRGTAAETLEAAGGGEL